MSASTTGSTWAPRWIKVTSMPRSRRFSAISRPMNPAPTTVALRAPVRSMKSWMAKVSSTVRRVNSRSPSTPGRSGTTGRAPGERMSLS